LGIVHSCTDLQLVADDLLVFQEFLYFVVIVCSNFLNVEIIKGLNLEVDFMKGKIVSTENIAVAVWEQIEAEIKGHGAELYCVKLVETENNFVEYFGN